MSLDKNMGMIGSACIITMSIEHVSVWAAGEASWL
jgi:hypothetical protein